MTSAIEYHTITAHHPRGPGPRDPRLVDMQPMDPATRPPQSKTYEGLVGVELSEDVSGDRLSRLLFGSAGVTRVAGPIAFRAAGSAGNLHPLEVYLLGDGALSHYDPLPHALVRLREIPSDTPSALVVTGVPWRTGWKYRERGFRHLYWDAGSMLAQTLELEPRARVELGFVDEDVTALVGADGVDEFPLAVVALDGEARLPKPQDVPRGRLGSHVTEFPLVTEVQRAGDIAGPEDVAAWRASQGPVPESTWSLPGDLVDLIRRRGSTRSFDPSKPGSHELLLDAMGWATRPVPGDFTSSTLLEHYVVVHDVEGVEPGAYLWGADEPLRTGTFRDESRFLCLGQPLGGDGAYTVFHCVPLHDLDDRRYRAALLEAGVVSGRLHLAAFSLGYGATGLTYFDEEVRRFFGTQTWPLLVTAVGKPAYRNRRGGLPREPVALER